MATNFPNSPSNGDTHTFGGATYTYNSARGAWLGPSSGGSGGASVTVSETAPTSPSEGDLWFDPSVLKTFVYYNDGTANQWVQNNPTGGGGSGGGGASVTVSETAPSSPSAGDLWWSSSEAAMYIYYTDADSSQWVQATTPGADGAAGAAGSAAVYATIDLLPASANTGDQAFVTGSNRLYLWNGTGWYNIALINTNPTISGVSASYVLATDGTATTVTITASDPEGIPITYSLASDTSGSVATVTQGTGASTNVFTITPSTSSANAGTFTLTFRASDGVNLASAPAEFSLEFSVVNSHYTSALITSVGANNAVNNTFIDSSSSSHTITASGDATQTTFSPYRHGGYSTYFDGSGDYLLPAADAAFAVGTGDFTIEFWMYAENISGAQNIWDQRTGAGFTINLSSSKVGFYSESSPTGYVVQSAALNNNEWYHVAFVRTGSAMVLYLNGVSVDTGTTASNYTDNSPKIGVRYSADQQYFTGYLSDIRSVKGTAVYASAFTPPTGRLTAVTYTSLLTCHLPYIADGSTNEHSITVNGNPKTLPFAPYDAEKYSTADHGGSMYFDGSGDYVSMASDTSFGLGTGDFTIEWWAYQTATPSYAQVFAVGNGAGGIGALMRNNGDIAVSRAGASIDHTFAANLSSSGNTWYHVALVRNGSTLTCFVNGTSVGTATNSINYAASHLNIGIDGNNSSSPFTGIISDFRIVKGTAVYASAFTPPTTPLTAITNTSLLLKGTNAGIIDKSQSVQTLTLNGDVKSSTAQAKYLSSSMYFDGTGDYCLLPASEELAIRTSDFTIEYWFNCGAQSTSYATQVGTLDSGTASGSWRFGTQVGSASGVYFAYHNGSTFVDVTFTTTNYNDNTWHHAAVTRSGSTVRAFIDGVQVGSNQTITQDFSTRRIVIGAELYSPTYYTGYMSDLRITKGLARYTAAFTPPTAALKG